MTGDWTRAGPRRCATGMVASIVGVAGRGIDADPQAGAQVPVVSKDPAVQRQIEMQLVGAASVRLDPNARIASLSLINRPLREILDAVAKESGMTFRYAQGMTGRLSIPSTVTLSDRTVEDALRTALDGHAMTFLAMGPKTAFIYPDTPADRDKYTASIRVFPIAKANMGMLAQQLNQAMKPTSDGFRPMVLTAPDSRSLVVRAIPELMTWIATWIAEHDKARQCRQQNGPRAIDDRARVSYCTITVPFISAWRVQR